MADQPLRPSRWDALRRFTDARIALGRAGVGLPTAPHLALRLAHAQARDAVHLRFEAEGVGDALRGIGLEPLLLHSAAADRTDYLQRPDHGRRLDDRSRQTLAERRAAAAAANADEGTDAGAGPGARGDVAFIVCDGLSALAVHRHAAALLGATLARLRAGPAGAWTLTPVAVVEQGRVAIGDEIGHALQAGIAVVLIGERPGLSSADSLGVYLTWAPRPGLTDASRNCISNIRPAGLSIEAAASKLVQLLTQARSRCLSGIGLKDEVDDRAALADGPPDRMLLL